MQSEKSDIRVTRGTFPVAVDHNYFYQPMATCPRGVEVQLLTKWGRSVPGYWDGKDKQFVGWAGRPKIPDSIKALMA